MERVGGAIAPLQQRHNVLRSLAQEVSLPRGAVKHQMRIAPLQPMERHTTIDSPDGFANAANPISVLAAIRFDASAT